MIIPLLVVMGISMVAFVVMTSHTTQLMLHRYRARKLCVDTFRRKVKGRYVKEGYFGLSHRIISPKEFKHLNRRHRINFYHCYNIVFFKTAHADWELFFYLVREGIYYSENLALRCFPRGKGIKSEGNVEQVQGRLNIVSNNRYLTGVLEQDETRKALQDLLQFDYDLVQVLPNNLYLKSSCSNVRANLDAELLMSMVRAMDSLREKVYREGIIEY